MSYIGSPTPPVIANVSDSSITPAKLSTGHPNWDSSSNVGIGTSSPTEPLDVVGTVVSNVSSTGDSNFKATSTGGGQYRLYPDDATTANPTWFHQTNSSEDQAFVIGGVERVRINSSGIVTRPNQPVFSGYQSGSNTGSTGGSTDYLVVCNGAYINNGSHYNTSTGIFTCPVAGMYRVSCYTMSITASANGVYYATRVRLYKNGSGIGNFGYNYGDGYRHVSGNWAVNCAANDTLGFMSNDSLGGYNWLVIELIG